MGGVDYVVIFARLNNIVTFIVDYGATNS